MREFLKYLREVSVVVIGVAVTLLASWWVTNLSEQRNVKQNLHAVKIELEENVRTIQTIIDYLRPIEAYSNYLGSCAREEISSDSTAKYAPAVFTHLALSVDFVRSAFEAFQNSGVMHLMKDRELLLEIWNGYSAMTLLEQGFVEERAIMRRYFMENDAPNFEILGAGAGVRLRDTVLLYDYYKLGLAKGILNTSESILSQLQSLLARMEEGQ